MQTIFAIPYIVWLIASAVSFAFGEYFSKKFAISPSWQVVVVVFAFYMLGVALWLPAIMERNQLSIVGVLWSVLSLSATVFIGVVIFGERLNGIGIAGLILGAVSVYVLSIA